LPVSRCASRRGKRCATSSRFCAGGSRLELVVNTTVLVADITDFGVVNEIFAEAFPVDPPARMVMQVPLPLGLMISIGCVAIVDSAPAG
jgi:2-iminobutanoate/2-iminopropanoate deaminase